MCYRFKQDNPNFSHTSIVETKVTALSTQRRGWEHKSTAMQKGKNQAVGISPATTVYVYNVTCMETEKRPNQQAALGQ